MAKRVVILGGGVGGTIVANLLAKRLRPEEAEITLVDKTGKHLYQPGLVYVAFHKLNPAKLVRAERKLLRRRVRLVLREIVRIDAAGRKVHLADGTVLDYDRLVVALGARLVPEELPGYTGAAHHFYSIEGAVRLREALGKFQGGRIVVGVGSVPYKCPPAPSEAACQLDYYFTRRGMRDKVDVHFLSPLSRVFPLEPVNPVVEKIFAKHGIRSTVFFNVESIDPEKRVVNSIEGESVPYDLLVMVPPHRGAKVVEDSGLGDRGGWLPTDKHTLRTKAHPDIFALGDCTDVPVSKSGAAAHFQAKVVADSVAADLRGVAPTKRYGGRVTCYCDAGYHKGISMTFDYEHPPVPPPLGFKDWLMKQILNKAYWLLIPTARV
ncbi:MAG TPA: FAD/NAD(P)-binding oxidoreductase [Thermoplasmata archaeon]|nr:FAD/NAD(P)-binding oxidoreductase [Thermoplasmata archaeon]